MEQNMLIQYSSMKSQRHIRTWTAVLAALLITGLTPLVSVAVSEESYTLPPLRDPFWPVGYFPENWQSGKSGTAENLAAGSDWDAPAALIRVNGTSRMGAQTAAIINGKVKSVGDLVEVRYGGRVYQWKLTDVQPSGKVKLERFTVVSDSSRLQKENEK